MTKIDTAIILAGGKGERLRPLTNNKPKVMVELAGKPILLWQIEWMKNYGVKKIILAVSYKYQVIKKYFKNGKNFGITIDYSIEKNPLGRGGAIKKALKSKLIGESQNFLVLNGDIITHFDLDKMFETHLASKSTVTILLTPYLSRWGIVKLNKQDHVTGFEEKPNLPYWINAGIYIFNKKIESLLPDTGDTEKFTFPKIKSSEFVGFKNNSFWRAVDVIKDRSEAEEYLLTGKDKFS